MMSILDKFCLSRKMRQAGKGEGESWAGFTVGRLGFFYLGLSAQASPRRWHWNRDPDE